MKRMQIYLTDELYEALKKEKSRVGAPMSEIIRRVLEKGLDSWLKKQKGKKE